MCESPSVSRELNKNTLYIVIKSCHFILKSRLSNKIKTINIINIRLRT